MKARAMVVCAVSFLLAAAAVASLLPTKEETTETASLVLSASPAGTASAGEATANPGGTASPGATASPGGTASPGAPKPEAAPNSGAAKPAGGSSTSKTKATAKGWSGRFQKPSDAELRDRLTPLQYRVTQQDGTEPAYSNEYWDNHEPGIYVDVVSGEPLFSSLDKYDSGTGWPSFNRTLESANVKIGTDYKVGYPRTEVRSAHAGSHLGHVFDDGPSPTGLRYCMNSAALRLIPAPRLAEEGYGKYSALFEKKKP